MLLLFPKKGRRNALLRKARVHSFLSSFMQSMYNAHSHGSYFPLQRLIQFKPFKRQQDQRRISKQVAANPLCLSRLRKSNAINFVSKILAQNREHRMRFSLHLCYYETQKHAANETSSNIYFKANDAYATIAVQTQLTFSQQFNSSFFKTLSHTTELCFTFLHKVLKV